MKLRQNERMTRRKGFMFLVLLPGLVSPLKAQDTSAFKLWDCIQFTLQHHPNSTIYRNHVEVAQQKVRENRSAFLPTVYANGTFDYNIKLQTSVIPAGTFGPEETQLRMGNKLSTGAYVQADQNILDRSSSMAIRSAKVEKEISDLNVLKENENLIYNAASAYYDVLTYHEEGKLLRKNEAQYQQVLEIVKLRYEQGVVRKNEYDRSRVNLNNVQSEMALNDNNYALALNKLKNAMGMDLQALLVIADSIDYAAQVNMPVYEELNTGALVSYQIDQKNVLLKEVDVQRKQAAYLPTLSLYGKYGVNAYGNSMSNAFDRWFDYSTIGLKLNVPVFSGFKKSSQLSQSKLTAASQRLTLKLNTDSYKLEYENSRSRLFSSYTSLRKNKENLDLAKQVVDATALEYHEGTATLSTFLDDDYSYKEARSNYITSLIDYLNAQLSFEKSKGTLLNYVTNLKK